MLEVAHIIGIAMLVGSLLLFELRVWGLGKAVPLPALASLALPVSLGGLALAAASGLVMFASQAEELLANQAFLLKMAVLAVAGLNAVVFHLRGGIARADRLARWQCALSLGLWVFVILCGRWIAYL